MKKTISLILIFSILILTLSSCGKKKVNTTENNTENGEESINYTMKLAYVRNDSLNPFYLTSTLNNQLSKLVYEGLFKIDSSYSPQPQIAKSYTSTANMISVTLGDRKFSDGTTITPGDVIYSFNSCKNSDIYSGVLTNILSCAQGDTNSVVFTLESKDPYALSCLDFPIVKQNTDINFPVGSGRYYYTSTKDSIYLVVNKYNPGFNPTIRVIKLEYLNENETMESSLVIGNTAFYFNDLNDGIYKRVDARSVDVGINNLVYLGFNSYSDFFSIPELRQAVSYAIDRSEIVSTAFRSHARETSTPFNPDWYMIEDGTYSVDVNMQKAAELIEKSGVDLDVGEVTIMYNGDNEFKSEMAEIIADSLSQLGFHIRLKAYNPQEFMYDIDKGSFDIFIGEMKISNNMNLNPLLTGEQAYGVDEESESVLAYATFLDGGCELMDFINTFSEDVPFVPVCYRNGLCLFTKSMNADLNSCDNDVFYDIESWSLK